jgi:hypothetical protein
MIRFVDLRGQDLGERFAFWNTTSDAFLCVDGESAWTTWDEFAELHAGPIDYGRAAHPGTARAYPLERYRSLCPAWVFEPAKDGECFGDLDVETAIEHVCQRLGVVIDHEDGHGSGRWREVSKDEKPECCFGFYRSEGAGR